MVPWSNAIGGSAFTGCQRVSGGSSGSGGGGHQAQKRRRNGAGAGNPVWVGEHGQLLEVSQFTQVHFLGQLTPN